LTDFAHTVPDLLVDIEHHFVRFLGIFMKKVLTVFSVLLALLLLMPDAFGDERLDNGRNVVYDRSSKAALQLKE
jgi:hypothetical protein